MFVPVTLPEEETVAPETVPDAVTSTEETSPVVVKSLGRDTLLEASVYTAFSAG